MKQLQWRGKTITIDNAKCTECGTRVKVLGGYCTNKNSKRKMERFVKSRADCEGSDTSPDIGDGQYKNTCYRISEKYG